MFDTKNIAHIQSAVAYVRASTDQQQYSIENQLAAITEYAKRNNMAVHEVYDDKGISGLTYDKRHGLKRLMQAVQSGQAAFSSILVFDVSRWGRFQDVDESAYYEYACRKNGIDVHYVKELFQNDNMPLSSILKAIRRAMAGEYSRDLSAKVSNAKIKLAKMGFRGGGTAGYGLRRAAVDERGNIRRILTKDERKSHPCDRIILVPGPKKEIDIVRFIFKAFVHKNWNEVKIAKYLNSKRIKSDLGRVWTKFSIKNMLESEKYIGNHTALRKVVKLGARGKSLPREQWVRVDRAFVPIVEDTLFKAAQERILRRKTRITNEDLLKQLHELRKKRKHLTAQVIDSEKNFPGSYMYVYRFGTLVNAYKKIGYKPRKDYELVSRRSQLRLHKNTLIESIAKDYEKAGIIVRKKSAKWNLFAVLNKSVSVTVAYCLGSPGITGKSFWVAPIGKRRTLSNYLIVIQLDEENKNIKNYYLIPTPSIRTKFIYLPNMKTLKLQNYQVQDVDELFMKLRQCLHI